MMWRVNVPQSGNPNDYYLAAMRANDNEFVFS